jgi:hypothetical protein
MLRSIVPAVSGRFCRTPPANLSGFPSETKMTRKLWLPICLTIFCAGCGGSEPPAHETPAASGTPAVTATPSGTRRETVFDPLVGTIDRAKGVQTTVDDQAEEVRRRVEEAER